MPAAALGSGSRRAESGVRRAEVDADAVAFDLLLAATAQPGEVVAPGLALLVPAKAAQLVQRQLSVGCASAARNRRRPIVRRLHYAAYDEQAHR